VIEMVNVTERARDRLKALRETTIDDPAVGLRLETTASGEFGVFPDRQRTDDQVIEHRGAVVLLVSQEIAERVEDTTIDYDESPPGPRLVIKKD
jgi:Fe-S cluster assembly iron-binding protein IscA